MKRRASIGLLSLALIALPTGAGLAAAAGPVAALDDPAVFEQVVAQGAAALPELAAALPGPRPDLAVHALGRLRLTQAVPLLLPLAADADGEVRAAVAWALGESGGKDAVSALVTLSADPYPPAREAALLGLARTGAPAAEPVLQRALTDADESLRLAAVRAVGAGGRKEWAALLLPRLSFRIEMLPPPPRDHVKQAPLVPTAVWAEPAAGVRLAAVQALGQLRAVDGLPTLIQAMEREESFNRLAIVRAVREMGAGAAGVCLGRIVPLPYDKESFAKYMPVLINNGTLAVIAGQLGDERCVPYLLDVLKLPRENLGTDKDLTELYIQAVELLGRYRVERAARSLAELLKQAQVSQLSTALQAAVRAIGHPAARPLARNMDNWQVAPVFLELLREKELRTPTARDRIAAYLLHESDEVRLAATETFGLYLYEGIVDEYDQVLLDAMYLDPNPEVRARCEYWKERIRKKQDGGAAAK